MRDSFVKQLIKVLATVFSIGAFLLIWHFGVSGSRLDAVMPGSFEVMRGFILSFVEPIGRHTMLYHILWSLMRVVPAYIAGAVIGILLGITMGWYRMVDAVFMPIYEIIRPIPPIAWIPISIVWFGIGEGSKWFIIFLAAFIPITMNCYAGAKATNPTLVGCARMLGANDRQIFTSVVLPSAVPYIFAGLQVGLAGAWATVVAAEMIRSTEGVGWIIISSMETNDVLQSLIGIMGIGVVGFFLALIMRGVEDRLCAWNKRQT